MDLKSVWKKHYAVALPSLKDEGGHGRGLGLQRQHRRGPQGQAGHAVGLDEELGLDEWQVLNTGNKRIDEPADVLRGFLECFSKGIAQEWMVSSAETFSWMRDHLGHDRNQMAARAASSPT